MELTDRGREYAASQLDVEPTHRRRGGIVHQYWQHRIVARFEAAGWPAKRELFDADVYVNMADTELVVEVAMGDNAREAEHVHQHLEKGLDAAWVVCKDRAVRDGIRERVVEHGWLDDRVTFRLFRDIPDMDEAAMA